MNILIKNRKHIPSECLNVAGITSIVQEALIEVEREAESRDIRLLWNEAYVEVGEDYQGFSLSLGAAPALLVDVRIPGELHGRR